MLWNQEPRVIRHRSRVLGAPASRAIPMPATPPGREVVSWCPRRKRSGSVLWIGEQTAW
jgi:hypothetical protein